MRRKILFVVNLLIPLFAVLIPVLAAGKSIADVVPVWGDETWWWQQANAISAFGRPLGYWGYNGVTAPYGTFAAWGAAPAFPYGLFAAAFGWKYGSFVYANLFYQTLAIGLFLVLTKPDGKSLALLTLINATQAIRNAYLVVCMQESVRSAFALVAAGLLIWLYRRMEEDTKAVGAVKALTGLFLFVIGQLYLMWTGFFFPYFLILHRKLKPAARLAAAAAETGCLMLASQKLLGLTSSPYYKQAVGLFKGILSNMRGYYYILRTADVAWFFKWYHGGLTLLAAVLAVYLLVRWRSMEKEDRILLISALTVYAAFLGGHIVLYNTTLWTFTRGMAMGILVFSFVTAAMKKKFPACAVAVWGAVCLLLFCTGHVDATFFNDDRFRSEAWEARIAETKDMTSEMEDALRGERSHDPWTYTVATYAVSSDPVTLSLPKGFSENAMIDGEIRTEAAWIAIGKDTDPEKAEEYRAAFLKEGYLVSGESDTLLILHRK